MKKCFIISPIGEFGSEIRQRSDEILNHIIRPVLYEHGYEAIRADEISEFGLITNQIIEHIAYDDLVISDLTYKNPNVYYELAIRHVVQKPIIQLIDEKDELPFDVINTRTIKINHRNLTGADNAKKKISEYLKKIEGGNYKIETPTSRVIDFDITLFDRTPISNINITYSKIYELLKKAEKDINEPVNIMSTDYINKMKEVDRLKSAFLSNLSHKIRTPINAIVGFSTLIGEDDIDPFDRKMYGQLIASNAKQLLKMMNNIVELTYIESNQVTVKISNGDINTTIENFFNDFKINAGDYSWEIDINLLKPDNSNYHFITDHYLIGRVLVILLENALYFTRRKGRGKIEIYYKIENNELLCSVKDTGIGISSKDYSVIFEKFRRVEIEDYGSSDGNGIGLTIAKGLIEKLGGRIWVESQVGVGSTFFFSVPELTI